MTVRNFSWIFALLGFLRCCAAALQVVCPVQEVEASPGDDVLLPCHTEPQIDLSDATLDWFRPDLSHFVYVYRNQKDVPQMDQYAGQMRVEHRGLRGGNLSLLIRSIGPSDSGPYRSFIIQYRSGCTVQLNVVNRSREVTSTVTPSSRAPELTDGDTAHLSGGQLASIIVAVAILLCVAAGGVVLVRRGVLGKAWRRLLRGDYNVQARDEFGTKESASMEI